MKSSRRVAMSLGLATLFGGGLLFSFNIANSQPASTPPGSSGAVPISTPPGSGGIAAPPPLINSSTGAVTLVSTPPLKQTIGISPAQPVRQTVFNVFGGTGAEGVGESYDLQSQNVYSLLRQRGVPIPNVLYPTSTAKPSFIVERLIVLSVSGAGSNSNSGSNSSAPAPAPSGGARGETGIGGGAAQAPAGPTDAERTVTDVRRVVDAEISRGSGRLGGDHLRKLRYLSRAIRSLEGANPIGSAVSTAIGGAGGGQAAGGQSDTKIDPREVFYGNARKYARLADRLAPKGF